MEHPSGQLRRSLLSLLLLELSLLSLALSHELVSLMPKSLSTKLRSYEGSGSGSDDDHGLRLLRRHELRARQRGETAVLRDEFVEIARLDDLALVEHDDAIGVAHGR